MTQLIFACDVSDNRVADELLTKIAPHIDMVKIGLEAMTAPSSYGSMLSQSLLTRAKMFDKDVMWDIKLHDVANTMRGATRNIVGMGVKMFTVHASASDEALAAVAEEAGSETMVLAVTALTDLNDAQCFFRYHGPSWSVVKRLAKNAHHRGIRGFVCSAHEARIIRETVPDAYIVTPGIRPEWAVAKDEQKRVVTPARAKQAGVDAIVVGRPISNPPPAYTEASAARLIREELDAA